MILQNKKMNTYSRYISEFKGLNRLPVIDDGELMSSENMVFDLYPVMTVRKGRKPWGGVSGTPQGILLVDETVITVSDGTLYVDHEATPLTGLSDGMKSVVEFWGKIFVFPDKKYYDINSEEYGDMGTGVFPEEGSVPDMDYVCVHNNRIWGVKGNYIYASANGWAMGEMNAADIPGWTPCYDAQGYPNDLGACWFEVASDGKFTGVSSWDDKIVALKEHCHHEITGTNPSNFALSTVSKCGTVGHFTIQEVDGKLIFVSDRGVQSYGGSFENNIGRNLNEDCGTAKIYSCGSDGIRYYLSGEFDGLDKLYVYDTFIGAWTEEDALRVVQFARGEGYLLALCDNGQIYRLRCADSTESVLWSFSFSDYADSVYNESKVSKLILKVKGEEGANLKVEMAVDQKDFEILKEYTFDGKFMQTIKCDMRRGCEHLFRVSGSGEVEVYGYHFVAQNGGERIV